MANGIIQYDLTTKTKCKCYLVTDPKGKLNKIKKRIFKM